MLQDNTPWYRQLNGYHWFVLIVCTGGWLFDCLDQQLFNLARVSAVKNLLGVENGNPEIDRYSGIATSILLIGWATGGIIFGIVGDRIGRAKTMIFTLLSYSVFSGLSGLAPNLPVFLALRFLAGLGVGGQFALGVTLVSESVPTQTRTHALGMLQAFSAGGNIAAGLIYLGVIQIIDVKDAWRYIFWVSVLPALILVYLNVRYLHEPEAWLKSAADKKTSGKKGGMTELFSDPRWRKRTIVGMMLASAGVLGLWAIGVFSNDMTQTIFRKKAWENARLAGDDKRDLAFAVQLANADGQIEQYREKLFGINPKELIETNDKQPDARPIALAAVSLLKEKQTISPESVLAFLDKETGTRKPQTAEERARRAKLLAENVSGAPPLAENLDRVWNRQKEGNRKSVSWACVNLILFNIGAFFGMYSFARVTNHLGRRPTFAIFFTLAMASTAIYFLFMNDRSQLYWMAPLMGFAQLSVFGGYAIYFPELFPTRMRSTGTSFCYNIARYLAAAGPTALGWLSGSIYGGLLHFDEVSRFRYAGVTMCACFLVGLIALLFAPETKDRPLPE
jgi:MFS family permease